MITICPCLADRKLAVYRPSAGPVSTARRRRAVSLRCREEVGEGDSSDAAAPQRTASVASGCDRKKSGGGADLLVQTSGPQKYCPVTRWWRPVAEALRRQEGDKCDGGGDLLSDGRDGEVERSKSENEDGKTSNE